MNSLQILQTNNLWADLEHSRPSLLPEQSSLTPVETSEDHDDTFFFPYDWMSHIWKHRTLIYYSYMCIYLCEGNTSLHLYSFWNKEQPEVSCWYLNNILSFFLTTFFLNRTLITENQVALGKINYSGNSSLVLDTTFLQPVGLLDPLGPLELLNAM